MEAFVASVFREDTTAAETSGRYGVYTSQILA
jgi:hypothetical protein